MSHDIICEQPLTAVEHLLVFQDVYNVNFAHKINNKIQKCCLRPNQTFKFFLCLSPTAANDIKMR